MMTTESADVNLSIPIGEVVKAWRERRGLTVTQLAERTGRPITKGYISELERGKIRQPGDDHLVLLSRALQIPILYLVSRRLPDRENGAITAEGTPTLRRRRARAFASPPIEDASVEDETVGQQDEILGQQIEMILDEEGLSQEERSQIAEVLVPHARQLARMMRLLRGIST
jgi:transcriptional regulator with XRE-family HTH domain